ncbi:hypothetical protein BH10BAC3_BH10BAC3_30800 [soil metagenome]
MKILSIILYLFLFPGVAFGQFQIDKTALSINSLKKVLPFLHDSARVDCLNELARSYSEIWQFDSTKAMLNQAYKEADSLEYIKGSGDACNQYGMLYFMRYLNHAESEKYFREAVSCYKKIQDEQGLGHAFRGLGIALKSLSDPDGSTKAFEQSAFYFRKTGNLVMLADLTDLFGNIYGAKGDFEKQFEFVKKALKEKKRINDNRGLIWSYYRLAHIYQSIGDYETALAYFRQSYQQAFTQSLMWKPNRSMGNIFLSLENYDSSLFYFSQGADLAPPDLVSLTGLGKIAVLRKEFDKGLFYLQNALASYKEIKNDIGAVPAMIEMAKAYTGKKNYISALQYAKACLAIAMKTGDKLTMQQVYEINWRVYKELKKTDSAYFYFEKFISLKDSLDKARLNIQNIQKLALYKVETKEEEQLAKIELLNKDNKIKKQQLKEEALMKKVLAGSLAILLLFGFIVFRYISLNRKNETHQHDLVENELQIQRLDSERRNAELLQQKTELELQALRAQMNPHFIFNSLNSINRFIFQNQRTEAIDYLTKFSRLIRKILHSSANVTVSLSDELAALQLYMELESLRFEEKFDFKIDCEPDIDIDFIQVPPMILQPYVENAIWHGLMLKKGKGNLWVNISQHDTILIFTVTDNGIGREKAAELKDKSISQHRSMGMRITADRMALLQQKHRKEMSVQVTDLVFSDSSPAGTEVVIKIPFSYD